MMKRTATLGSLLILLFFGARFALAETASDQPYVKAMRALSINHSLLAKAEAEYKELEVQESRDTTGRTAKLLNDLRYKIQAFNEDAERLRAMIPAGQAVPASGSSIDIAAEKELDEKLNDIYRMHEKALQSVAARHFDEAEKIYEEIVLLSPDDEEAYMLLGHTCLAGGDYEKAGQAFHSAIHIDPQNARQITRLYENILVENPSDDEAMTQLGYAHLLLGSAPNAKRAFQDALAVNPSNIEAKKGLLEIP